MVLDEIFAELRPTMFTLAYRITGNRADARKSSTAGGALDAATVPKLVRNLMKSQLQDHVEPQQVFVPRSNGPMHLRLERKESRDLEFGQLSGQMPPTPDRELAKARRGRRENMKSTPLVDCRVAASDPRDACRQQQSLGWRCRRLRGTIPRPFAACG